MSEAEKKVTSILKKPSLCAEWTTVIPDESERLLSPKFLLKSIQCQFELYVGGMDELCLDVLRTDELEISECFKCTVIVSQEDLQLPAPTIREHFNAYKDINIWEFDISDLELSQIRGKPISFLVVLEVEGGSPQEQEGNDWFGNSDKSLHSLCQDFAKLLRDAPKADIKLLCGDLTMSAHGNILSARSEVFEKMLQTGKMEKRKGSIKIPDIQPEVIQEFLQYIYTGTLPEITVAKVLQLYKAGYKYKVRSLVEECASYLRSSLADDNVCKILALADDHSDPELKERAICFISQEKIPLEKPDIWKKFSDQRPKLAHEAVQRAYKDSKHK